MSSVSMGGLETVAGNAGALFPPVVAGAPVPGGSAASAFTQLLELLFAAPPAGDERQKQELELEEDAEPAAWPAPPPQFQAAAVPDGVGATARPLALCAAGFAGEPAESAELRQGRAPHTEAARARDEKSSFEAARGKEERDGLDVYAPEPPVPLVPFLAEAAPAMRADHLHAVAAPREANIGARPVQPDSARQVPFANARTVLPVTPGESPELKAPVAFTLTLTAESRTAEPRRSPPPTAESQPEPLPKSRVERDPAAKREVPLVRTHRQEAAATVPEELFRAAPERKGTPGEVPERKTPAPAERSTAAAPRLLPVTDPAADPRGDAALRIPAAVMRIPAVAPVEPERLSTAGSAPASAPALPPPEYRPGPAREIAVRLAGPETAPVDLHVRGRGSELRVAVRTGDAQLQTSLRRELPELIGRLEQAGYRTGSSLPGERPGETGAAWAPAVSDGGPVRTRAEGESGPAGGSGGEQQGGQPNPDPGSRESFQRRRNASGAAREEIAGWEEILEESE